MAMIVSCSNCQTQFRMDEQLLLPDGRALACSKCQHQWFEPVPEHLLSQANPETSAPENYELSAETPQSETSQGAVSQSEISPQSKSDPFHRGQSFDIPDSYDDAQASDKQTVDSVDPLRQESSQSAFLARQDITERLARIRESVQPQKETDTETIDSENIDSGGGDSDNMDLGGEEPQNVADAPDDISHDTPNDAPNHTIDGVSDGDSDLRNTDLTGADDQPNYSGYQDSDDVLGQDRSVSYETPIHESSGNDFADSEKDAEQSKTISDFSKSLSRASQMAQTMEVSQESQTSQESNVPQIAGSYKGNQALDSVDSSPVDKEPTPEETQSVQQDILSAVRQNKGRIAPSKPKHLRHNRPWAVQILTLLFVALLLVSVLALVTKDKVVQLFPETESYYNLLGIETQMMNTALIILEPTATLESKDGQTKLVISGVIENRYDRIEPVPTLMAQIKDGQGKVLNQWTFNAKAQSIPVKGKITYTTAIDNPSAQASYVAVTIAKSVAEKNRAKPQTDTSKTKTIGAMPTAKAVKK